MRKNHGFTLIELMIVVAIIAIIAAIAIPNLLRSRVQSNESSAIGDLKTVVAAETAYHAANAQYAQAFDDLTNATPRFLDGQWDGIKNGYTFTLGAAAAGATQNFLCTALPQTVGTTGNRGFAVDAGGVVHFDAAGGAPDMDGTDNIIGDVAS